MKKMNTLIVGLAFSANIFAANVDTSYFQIDKLRISEHTGNAYIDPVGGTEDKNSTCSQKSLYAFHKDDELFNQIYSTALAAAASGKQVKVWVSDESGDCLSSFQKIRIIEIDF